MSTYASAMRARAHFWLSLIWRPWWRLVNGTVWILGLIDLALAQFVSAQAHESVPRFFQFLPAWSWQTWAVVLLALLLFTVLEGSFRRVQLLEHEIDADNQDDAIRMDRIVHVLSTETIEAGGVSAPLLSVLEHAEKELAIGCDFFRLGIYAAEVLGVRDKIAPRELGVTVATDLRRANLVRIETQIEPSRHDSIFGATKHQIVRLENLGASVIARARATR